MISLQCISTGDSFRKWVAYLWVAVNLICLWIGKNTLRVFGVVPIRLQRQDIRAGVLWQNESARLSVGGYEANYKRQIRPSLQLHANNWFICRGSHTFHRWIFHSFYALTRLKSSIQWTWKGITFERCEKLVPTSSSELRGREESIARYRELVFWSVKEYLKGRILCRTIFSSFSKSFLLQFIPERFKSWRVCCVTVRNVASHMCCCQRL